MKRPIKNQNRPRHVRRSWYERAFKMLVSAVSIHAIPTNYKDICSKFLGSVKGGGRDEFAR